VRRWRRRLRRLVDALDEKHEDLRADVFFVTGDYMSVPGDEAVSLEVMRQICQRISPPLGSYGVFGNHDSPRLRRDFEELPIRWLNDDSDQPADARLHVMGFFCERHVRADAVATLATLNGTLTGTDPDHRCVRVLLCHYPTFLPTAADMGIDLMFSGHTHGGQCRLPGRRALFNSTDLPLGLSSGLLRHRDTVCAVTRGFGDNLIPVRTFCPPQIPVYTLRRGPMIGRRTDHIENVVPW
jgi:predicted MPP superfamily phosphohydrolase